MSVEASPLTLKDALLCADVQVNWGLWELEVPQRHLFLLTSHSICSLSFCRDQYPPQFMWVFVEIWAADDRLRFGYYFEPTTPGKFSLIFRQCAEYWAANTGYLSELKCRAEHLFEARCCASRRHSIIPINNLNYNRFSKQIPDISSSSSIKSHFSVICNRKRPVGDDYIAEFLQRCSDESRRFQCSKCLFTGAWRAHLAS